MSTTNPQEHNLLIDWLMFNTNNSSISATSRFTRTDWWTKTKTNSLFSIHFFYYMYCYMTKFNSCNLTPHFYILSLTDNYFFWMFMNKLSFIHSTANFSTNKLINFSWIKGLIIIIKVYNRSNALLTGVNVNVNTILKNVLQVKFTWHEQI